MTLLSGCGSGAGDEASSQEHEQPVDRLEGAGDWDLERTRSELEALGAEVEEARDAVTRARLARQRGQLARMLAARTGDAADLNQARAWLTSALAAPADEVASWSLDAERCEAGDELVKLESIEAHDLAAARRVAAGLVERFAVADERPDAAPEHAADQLRLLDCLRRARRMSASLDGAAELDGGPQDPHAFHGSEVADGGTAESAGAGGPAGAGVGAPGDEAARSGDAPTLRDIAVYSGGEEGARAVLRFDGIPTFTVGQSRGGADEPPRAWLDIANVVAEPTLGETWRVASGGLQQVRRLTTASGGVRVLFDLMPGARHRVFALPEPFRLVVDIESPISVARAVQPRLPRGAPHPRASYAGPRPRQDRARGVGRAPRDQLAWTGHASPSCCGAPWGAVLLTRQADVTPLLGAHRHSRAVGADLAVIHLNAADEPVEHGGVTTFGTLPAARQVTRLGRARNGHSARSRTCSGCSRACISATDSPLAASWQEPRHLAGGRRSPPLARPRGAGSSTVGARIRRHPARGLLPQARQAAALGTLRYRQALAEGIAAGITRYVSGS
ncbi:MAG: AMIN domain-containing protein [Sandaracinaceae bacterium]|nr:AMIN domain-containing protein [Sandaracinaceae bacterium]